MSVAFLEPHRGIAKRAEGLERGVIQSEVGGLRYWYDGDPPPAYSTAAASPLLVRLPDQDATVVFIQIRDKAGNESNPLPLYIQRARRGRLAQAIALEESAEDSTAKGEHDQAKTLLAEALVKLAEIHDAAMLAKGASAKTADQQYVIDVTSQTAALVALAGANMNASSGAQASFVLSQALEQQRTLAKWARAKGLEL